MKPFTVILQRSFEMSEFMEEENDEHQYAAFVEGDPALGYVTIIKAAQKQAFEADCKDMGRIGELRSFNRLFNVENYRPLYVFEGHIKPLIYAFSPEAQACI